ncbi:uncharacterized protein N7459_001486 [Penicillium hispanicum]|uniref:uncharacterized protein n=1 Tax=Penicillium hispanicum TaxID=1080232 RepID=UPI002540AE28|nr:uncharacterized protein N7459_001486 [Penicillium hispanicum]KAJ5595278.1 hypothetical protein N7459_001486 [Penicillium hispanicum]
MSTPEESPAQRAARQRRERREAKIREGGSARLDKITSLSGRTPQTVREEASPSPQPAVSPSPSPVPQNRPSHAPQIDMPSAESLQAQQEAFRAMLRQSAPEQDQGQGQGQQAEDMEDPTIKLLNSLLGAMPGDPNAPPPPPGAASGAGGMPGQAPGMSPAAIASALGVPPFFANMLGGAAQPTEQEQKSIQIWKTVHVLFALGVATYLLFVIGTSVTLFGSPPPKPATAQNPFLIFVTGELLLTSGRILMSGGKGGLGMAVKAVKDIIRDGSLVIFMLGLGSWYYREWQTIDY